MPLTRRFVTLRCYRGRGILSNFGGARLPTSRRRFALARRVRLAGTLAPPKDQIDALPNGLSGRQWCHRRFGSLRYSGRIEGVLLKSNRSADSHVRALRTRLKRSPKSAKWMVRTLRAALRALGKMLSSCVLRPVGSEQGLAEIACFCPQFWLLFSGGRHGLSFIKIAIQQLPMI